MIYRYSALNVFDWNSYTMVVQSQTKFDDFIFYMKRIETAPNIITSKTTSKCIRHFYSCVKISVIISLIKICFDIENHIFRKFESLPFKTHTHVILFVFHHNWFSKLGFFVTLYFLIFNKDIQRRYKEMGTNFRFIFQSRWRNNFNQIKITFDQFLNLLYNF